MPPDLPFFPYLFGVVQDFRDLTALVFGSSDWDFKRDFRPGFDIDIACYKYSIFIGFFISLRDWLFCHVVRPFRSLCRCCWRSCISFVRVWSVSHGNIDY